MVKFRDCTFLEVPSKVMRSYIGFGFVGKLPFLKVSF